MPTTGPPLDTTGTYRLEQKESTYYNDSPLKGGEVKTIIYNKKWLPREFLKTEKNNIKL